MNGWTPKRRRRQAKLIQNWQPWTHSRGPRSASGKARSARNADKGGRRNRLRLLAAVLRDFNTMD